jgi:flagellar biosynthesis/type III secretory pathway protein FliH
VANDLSPPPTLPETLDHAAIMRLIREREGAFRQSPVAVPADGAFHPRATVAKIQPEPRPEARPEPRPVPAAAEQRDDFVPAPPIPQLDIDAMLAEARAEGRAEALAESRAAVAEGVARTRAEGVAEGRAAAEAEFAAARDAFVATAAALSRADAAAVEALQSVMEAAILRLASDRAGQAIDTSPAAFVARVATLARSLGQAASALEVRLHPADLAAIAPHLDGCAGLSGATLKADLTLSRGDAALTAGDVALSDLLSHP